MQRVKLARINEQMRLELSDLLRTVKDPRVTGLLSILKVEVTNDLSYAKVYVSSMEGMEGAKNAVKGLTNAAGYLRRELASRVKLRKSPELRFIADDSIAYSADIAKILDGLHLEKRSAPAAKKRRSKGHEDTIETGRRYPNGSSAD